jgi:small GTP-binding protein
MLSRRLQEALQEKSDQEASHISLHELLTGSNVAILSALPLPAEGPNRIGSVYTAIEENLVDILRFMMRNPYLESLDLSNLHLTALPEAIGEFAGLRHLYLHSNAVKYIPDSISRLQRLETLDLRNNCLKALPAALRALPRLKRIYLHNNDDIGLPPEILGPSPARPPGDPTSGESQYSRCLRYVMSRLTAARWLRSIRPEATSDELVLAAEWLRRIRPEVTPQELEENWLSAAGMRPETPPVKLAVVQWLRSLRPTATPEELAGAAEWLRGLLNPEAIPVRPAVARWLRNVRPRAATTEIEAVRWLRRIRSQVTREELAKAVWWVRSTRAVATRMELAEALRWLRRIRPGATPEELAQGAEWVRRIKPGATPEELAAVEWLRRIRPEATPEELAEAAELLRRITPGATPEELAEAAELLRRVTPGVTCEASAKAAEWLRRTRPGVTPLELAAVRWLHGIKPGATPDESGLVTLFGPSKDSVLGSQTLAPKDAKHATSLLAFYFDTHRRRLDEAKLLLIGQGGVGKTSLVKRLIDNIFDPDVSKTDGIAIQKWPIRAEDQREIRLNVWDFGGQEIMHSTHQFFLTKRSLYVIVLDARAGQDQGNLHYWLEMIRVYGSDSPVLIVVNKCDEHYERLDEKRLRLDYENKVKLACFHYVSCKTGDGVDLVLESIKSLISKLPHVSDWLPEDYFIVKRELESRARFTDFLTQQEYRTICVENKIANPADQSRLLRFLHDLGCVLHYDDPEQKYAFQDTRVLNPEWVTGGVYRILNNPTLLRKGDGVVSRRDLQNYLHCDKEGQKRFPEDRFTFLLDMMRRYELCVDFPDNDFRVLLPELLSNNEPDAGWLRPSERNDRLLNFQYHYTVLPRGLIPRFIVRTRHLLTEQPTVWRAGEVLNVEGCRVLIRGDVRTARVFIQVQGQRARQRRAALAVVRNFFHSIHATYGDLGAQAKLPLPRDPLAPPVDYELLLKLESEGVQEQWFEKAANVYNVSDLLDGVDERRFDVFLSYNSKDAALARELARHLELRQVRCWMDKQQLTPGEPWLQEIAAAIRECRTIGVLIGPHSVGGWHREELFVGLEYATRGNKRLIPVLLPTAARPADPIPGLEFLMGRTWVEFASEFTDEQMIKLSRAILEDCADPSNDASLSLA